MENFQSRIIGRDHYIKAFDGLRGLAILAVMFHHYTFYIKPDNTLEKLFIYFSHLGTYGVDLFFVLSGFLITGILLDSKGTPHFFRNFYLRRILRIFPLYYTYLILTFLVFPTVFKLYPTFENLWILFFTYCSNFIIVKTGQWMHSHLNPTWSLAIEEQFYIIWPFLVFFFNRNRFKKLCLLIICGAILCRFAMWSTGYNYISIYAFTLCRMDSLALGAYFATLIREPSYNSEHMNKYAKEITVILLCVFLFLFRGNLHRENFQVSVFGYLLVDLFMLQVLIFALYAPPGSYAQNFFSSKLLVFFGKYSYAIYIFHYPVREIVRRLFINLKVNEFLGTAIYSQLAFYIVASTLSVLTALVSWNLLEKHALKLKKHFY